MQLSKKEAQDRLYEFPYHHIPHFGAHGEARIARTLSWGLDYLCWTTAVLDEVRLLYPKSILDVGCGDGVLLGLLEEVEVRVGIDLSERAIAFAKAFHPEVDYLVMDVDQVSRTFDCVTLIEVLEHIPDQAIPTFLGSVKCALAKHGHLIISVPTTNAPLNPKHYRHYSYESLADQIGDGFRAERVLYVCKLSWWTSFINRLVVNRLWILNSDRLLSLTWHLYTRVAYLADEHSASHLILVASRR